MSLSSWRTHFHFPLHDICLLTWIFFLHHNTIFFLYLLHTIYFLDAFFVTIKMCLFLLKYVQICILIHTCSFHPDCISLMAFLFMVFYLPIIHDMVFLLPKLICFSVLHLYIGNFVFQHLLPIRLMMARFFVHLFGCETLILWVFQFFWLFVFLSSISLKYTPFDDCVFGLIFDFSACLPWGPFLTLLLTLLSWFQGFELLLSGLIWYSDFFSSFCLLLLFPCLLIFPYLLSCFWVFSSLFSVLLSCLCIFLTQFDG